MPGRRSRPCHARVAAALCALALTAATFWAGAATVQAAPAATTISVFADQLQSSPFMGFGVQLDPYDTLQPAQLAQVWPMIQQRLDFMEPGFLRVVEPASSYFGGYDASGNPVYRWSSPSVQELLGILTYAQQRGIPVVLGDWANPLIGSDVRVPVDFILALRNTYGFTEIRYYNVENEPNNNVATCPFACWAKLMQAVGAGLGRAGLSPAVALVGPDNENSWDDTPLAQALDLTAGLDADNPIGGDAWVTGTLQTIPGLIGAYDSHRYATVYGIQNGVFGDQVRARRLEISALDSAAKPYFAGEVGMVARPTNPFAAGDFHGAITPSLSALLDPSTRAALPGFVDSQPNIAQFDYGVWMGDMLVQGIDAGLSGASAWDLDDAMHTGGGYGSQNLKRWGFWNSLAGQYGYPASDAQPRPWYYAWSVLSRAFPAGSQTLVVASPALAGVRVAAARIPNASPYGGGYGLSLAVVNDSSSPAALTLSVPAVAGPLTFAQYDYFPGALAADPNGLPVPAQVLPERPAAGIPLSLPAGSLVVLTTRGFASPTALNAGATQLSDSLHGFSQTFAHSSQLTLASTSRAQFNYASARVTPRGRRPGYLEYRARQMTSFDLFAYFTKTLGATVEGSVDGRLWWPIALASTQPAPAVGGGQLLAQLLPTAALPAGTNFLRIELQPGTALTQVQLAANRTGPGCVSATWSGPSISGLTPGMGERGVVGAVGVAAASGRRVWRYCVAGGAAEVAVVFAAGRVQLVATDASGYALGGVPVQTPLGRLLRHYHGACPARPVTPACTRLRPIARGVLASPAGVVYLIGARHVVAEALAAPAMLAHGRSLLGAVRASGILRHGALARRDLTARR